MATTNLSNEEYWIDFQAVKKDHPPLWFFESYMGLTPKKAGTKGLRFSQCPNCGASSDNSIKVQVLDDGWHCYVCGEGGDTIKAMSLKLGVSEYRAALELIGGEPVNVEKFKVPEKKVHPEIEQARAKVIESLMAALPEVTLEALEYLQGRGLTKATVLEAHRRGLLRTLPSEYGAAKRLLEKMVGRNLMEKAGMWREDKSFPAIAFRPLLLISNNRRTVELRLLRPPKDDEQKMLRYGPPAPWGWKGESEKRILVVEGFIDLLSAVDLGTKRSIFGLPGCSNWRPEWFTSFTGADVLSALDPDQPGIDAHNKLKPVLEAAVGGPIGRYDFPYGPGDLNEQLKAKLGITSS